MKLFLTGFIVMLSLQTAGQIVRQAPKQSYTLNIPELNCNKTTEDGSDEVYVIILYKYPFGASGVKASPDKHWSMYPSGGRTVANNLFNFTLKEAQSIDILCIFMEED